MIKDIIITAAVVLAVGGALIYIIKEKKSGTKCIGCPSRGTCEGCSGALKNPETK